MSRVGEKFCRVALYGIRTNDLPVLNDSPSRHIGDKKSWRGGIHRCCRADTFNWYVYYIRSECLLMSHCVTPIVHKRNTLNKGQIESLIKADNGSSNALPFTSTVRSGHPPPTHTSTPMVVDPTYPLFPILTILGFVLVLIPLPWHLHAWNSGTCFYMMWAALACLNQFVNSVVWADNALNPAPVWCDICTLFFIQLRDATKLMLFQRYELSWGRTLVFRLHPSVSTDGCIISRTSRPSVSLTRV